MRLPVLDSSTIREDHFDGGSASRFDSGPKSIGAVKVLRISVTDRCNFRCVYCMPEEGVRWLPKDDILGFEEIEEVVRAAIGVHGIRRFKLTGGEPTVRHGIVDLTNRLARIPGVEDLSLTTNGFVLEDLAQPLKEAGLHRVTVSIDSLKPDRFKRITRTGDLAAVLRGLDRAEEMDFDALKINCVSMRGVNHDEFADFARLSLSRRLTVRFIEYMPLGDAAVQHAPARHAVPPSPGTPGEGRGEGRATTVGDRASRLTVDESELGPAGGCGAQDRGDVFISETEVRSAIERELGPLDEVPRHAEPGVGPANVYRLAQGNPKGRIGFISAMSAPFCSTCNRLRLTADGVLRSCLFEGGEVPIRQLLRSTPAPQRRQKLAEAMTRCVLLKPDVHTGHGNQQMSRIGG